MRERNEGIALITVLWLTVLLTVIASGFAFSMRGEAIAARNAISYAQARASADGAVERAVYEMQRPRNPMATELWQADGAQHQWQEGEVLVTAAVVDESAKIDLNSAGDALLKGLLHNVGGLDAAATDRVFDAIADWRDADDLKRPNGAEEADYRAAGLKYKPANAPFDTVGELQRVLGMTPEVFSRIAGSLTVYSRQAGINPATASRDVLLAIPNATPEMVDTYLTQRAEALQNKTPVPAFAGAAGFGVGAIPVWRVRAQATMPDGVTFVREAVVRPSPDVRRPLIALLWQEGAIVSAPAASASAQSETAPSANAIGNR